jgi:hypothetical protein
LKVFLRTKSFLVELLGSFMYVISSIYRDNLNCSFPIYILFISFSCLMLWLRIQALYWVRVERVDTLILSLILEEMLLVFSHSV